MLGAGAGVEVDVEGGAKRGCVFVLAEVGSGEGGFVGSRRRRFGEKGRSVGGGR